MKRFLSQFFLGLLAALILIPGPAWAFTVAINQYVEHPSLNEAVRGFKDQLKEDGLEVSFKEYNAQANRATVLQIVSQIAGDKPDLILAVATPSAQTTAQKIRDIPILFTAVTDPVDAGLVTSLEKPNSNITGTTDMNPIAAQIALIREIQPNAKILGIIYNSGETNSVVQVDIAKKAAQENGFTLKEAVTPNTAGVTQAVQSLVGKVDAIYLPTDNTVISTFDSILKVSLDHKIPLYPAEEDSVKKGGLAVLSISYYDLGRQTGAMATSILKDKRNPSDLPVGAQSSNKLVVNLEYAKKMGLPIPEAVLDRAQEIIK